MKTVFPLMATVAVLAGCAVAPPPSAAGQYSPQEQSLRMRKDCKNTINTAGHRQYQCEKPADLAGTK